MPFCPVLQGGGLQRVPVGWGFICTELISTNELAGRPFYLWAGMSARFLRSLLQEKGIPELPPPEHSLAYRRPTGGGS